MDNQIVVRTKENQDHQHPPAHAPPVSRPHLFDSDSSSGYDDYESSTVNTSGTEVRHRSQLRSNRNTLPRDDGTYFTHNVDSSSPFDRAPNSHREDCTVMASEGPTYTFKKMSRGHGDVEQDARSLHENSPVTYPTWAGDPSQAPPEYMRRVLNGGNAFRNTQLVTRSHRQDDEGYTGDSETAPSPQPIRRPIAPSTVSLSPNRISRERYTIASTEMTRPSNSLVEASNVANQYLCGDITLPATQRNTVKTIETGWETEEPSTPPDSRRVDARAVSEYEMTELPRDALGEPRQRDTLALNALTGHQPSSSTLVEEQRESSERSRQYDPATLSALTGNHYSLETAEQASSSSSLYDRSERSLDARRHPLADSEEMRRRRGETCPLPIFDMGIVPPNAGIERPDRVHHRRDNASLPGYHSGNFVTSLRDPTPPPEAEPNAARDLPMKRKNFVKRLLCL